MSDQRLRDLGAHIEGSIPMHDFDDLVRRGRRRVALRRAGSLAAVVVITIAVIFGVAELVGRGQPPGPSPVDRTEQGRDTWCPEDRRPDCFADIHGWIVYGDWTGLRAVSPAFVNPEDQIQLTDGAGEEPLGWSGDGTKLLIRRPVPGAIENEDFAHAVDLVVMNADGTEITLARAGLSVDGSISADGSRVIYSSGYVYASGWSVDGIYTVGTDGGTPRLIRVNGPHRFRGEELPEYPRLSNPEFSPDGTQIAYFEGMGDYGHSLRVMRSDGTGDRVLLYRVDAPAHIEDLQWSPDGQRLMFAGGLGDGGIWIIGVDGSGLTKVVPDGENPAWSPDGTRISYQAVGGGFDDEMSRLRIADADGTHVTNFGFGFGGSGPWNPLPLEQ